MWRNLSKDQKEKENTKERANYVNRQRFARDCTCQQGRLVLLYMISIFTPTIQFSQPSPRGCFSSNVTHVDWKLGWYIPPKMPSPWDLKIIIIIMRYSWCDLSVHIRDSWIKSCYVTSKLWFFKKGKNVGLSLLWVLGVLQKNVQSIERQDVPGPWPLWLHAF